MTYALKDRYHYWKVLEIDPKDSKRALCVCDCGTERSVAIHSLRYDRSKSCGCYKKNIGVIDEVGNRYGRLLVIERAESKPSGAAFKCLCDCGNTTVVLGGHLRAGTTKSCGCYKNDFLESLENDLRGQRFGKLVVLDREEKGLSKNSKWICECDCGETTLVNRRELISDKTKSCGCLDESYASYQINKTLNEFDLLFEKEVSYDDLIGLGGGPLRYDWRVQTHNGYFLLEYDGEQHFLTGNSFWSPRLEKHDSMKNDYAKEKGIKLYRINYKHNVIQELMKILKKEGLI